MVATELFSKHTRTHERPIEEQTAIKKHLYHPKLERTEKSARHLRKYGLTKTRIINTGKAVYNLSREWNNHIRGKGDYSCFTCKNRDHIDMEILWVNHENVFSKEHIKLFQKHGQVYHKYEVIIGKRKWYVIGGLLKGFEGKDILLSCLTNKMISGDNYVFDTETNRDLMWGWIQKCL